MARLIAPLALALVLVLTACGGQATPVAPAAAAALATTPDDVAREFVMALGSWEEPALRRIALPGADTDMRLSSQKGQWNIWIETRIGPQESVEITESTVDGDRASLVVRSVHEKGESGVRLSMVQVDGAWRVEAWDSYRP